MDWLTDIDRSLLFFINQTCNNTLFDVVMPWIREKKTWIPAYVLLTMWIIYRHRHKSWMIVLLIVCAVALSDQVASGLFKPLFHRLRPCAAPGIREHLQLLIPCGGGYSFFSSHAATHSCLSFLLIYLMKPVKLLSALFVLWAFLICLAQVYVAYHYPSDVFCGALCGVLIAYLLAYIASHYFLKLQPAS